MINQYKSSLTDFSSCHVKIIKHIHDLGELPKRLMSEGYSDELSQNAGNLSIFYKSVIIKHHKDEEVVLFQAIKDVLDKHLDQAFEIAGYIGRLTEEHRHLERLWKLVDSDLKKLEKGKQVDINSVLVTQLAKDYLAHAQFEEQIFLPIAEDILSHYEKAALGMSLHMRYAEPTFRPYI